MKKVIVLALLCLIVSGCATTPNSYYYDPYSYSYYYNSYAVEIISNPAGAKIEINNNYIGETPITWYAHGQQGVLANVVIRAYPISAGQETQTKILQGNTPLPRRVYFDMNLKTISRDYNININQ